MELEEEHMSFAINENNDLQIYFTDNAFATLLSVIAR